MQVLDALHYVRERLEQAGQEEAQRKAKLMLAFVVGCPPADLVRHWRYRLDEGWLMVLDSMTAKLIAGQPLQYLLGEAEFMGLPFKVGPGALIPRADTEIIAERAIALLKVHSAPLIADIGVGSGAIAVSLAYHLPQAQVYGVDISPAALRYAEQNAQLNQVEARCHFYEGDLLTPLAALNLRFDLIISNPPYVTRAEMEQLPAEVRQEPQLALDGGADGLDYYRRLAVEAAPLLQPGGYLLLEHGWQQQEQLATLLTAAGWQVTERLNDYGGRPRGIVAGRG